MNTAVRSGGVGVSSGGGDDLLTTHYSLLTHIKRLVADSRQIRPGDAFAAYPAASAWPMNFRPSCFSPG